MSVFVVIPSDSDLVHHGIKGQRKGRRRYQNEDGSLTALGRIRYGVGGERKSGGKSESSSDDGPWSGTVEGEGASSKRGSSSGSSSKSKKSKNYKSFVDGKYEEVPNEKTPQKRQRNYDAASTFLSKSSNISRSLADVQNRKLNKDRERYKSSLDLTNMSDDDLRKAISRMSAEKTYRNMMAENQTYKREKTVKRLQTIGDIAATGSSVIAFYSAIKDYRKRRYI